jgi:predicted alpha-1,2-mannosidase
MQTGATKVTGGTGTGAFVTFDQAMPNEEIEFSLGISTISIEQASINIDLQTQSHNFAAVLAKAESDWENVLSTVTIYPSDSISRDDLVQFYSSMYRTHMAPTSFEEWPSVSASQPVYMGFDRQVHTLPIGMKRYYSDMSIWDTHRTEMPWLALLDPHRASDMANSLLLMYKEGGDLPRWPMADGYTDCMIGTHAIVILVDSYLKGASFDINTAYGAMVQAATKQQAHAGRTDIEHYLTKGYVSFEASSKSAPETLEYAYDDWALGNFASKVMGLPEDAKLFFNRSENYRNVWAPDQQFFCARSSNGTFDCPITWLNVFDNTYVEGDAWHWRWFVPQNPAGLISLFGSTSHFVDQLNFFMAKAADDPYNILPNPYYWAGNEPDIFAPWLFNFAGRADLTQKWTRYQLSTQYSSKPDGIPGNDDFGTMSAWAIFASIGFYPQAGGDRYLIGSPMFPELTIHRELGNIHIVAHNASATNIYVSKVSVNGKFVDLVNAPWFSHKEIHRGAKLEYWMSSTPPRNK